MKIAVFNYSGNVGKTTTVQQMLAPRMPHAEVITIESINTDDAGTDHAAALRGRDFGEVYARVLAADSVIVDVGSSNIEDFMEAMNEYAGSEEIFDLFVVPVVSDKKQQKDTRATIDELRERGIPPEKVRVLFNRADRKTTLPAEFESLFEYFRAEQSFVLDERAVLYETGVFAAAAEAALTVDELAASLDRYKHAVAQAADRSERLWLSHFVADAARAVGVRRELDAAFAALTK
jgi:hypothetical protein